MDSTLPSNNLLEEVENESRGGFPTLSIDMTASIEAMMNQAMEKTMNRVNDQLDNALEQKVTAVLQRIATAKAGSSHNATTVAESVPAHPTQNASLGGAGISAVGGHPLPADNNAVVVVAHRESGDAYDVDTVSLGGSYFINEMFQSPKAPKPTRDDRSGTPSRLSHISHSSNHSSSSRGKENIDMAIETERNQRKTPSAADEKQQSPLREVADSEQTFWEAAAANYESKTDFGPEVVSHLSCAAQRFWTIALNEEKLNATKEKGKIPTNCKFMSVKPTNKPVFTTASPSARTLDLHIQKVQGTYAAMSAIIMNAVSELKLCVAEPSRIRNVADHLKDSLMLAGDGNQQLNALRRDVFKPSIPPHLKKICDSSSEDAENLFGDNIQEKLTEIKADNALRDEFVKKSDVASTTKGKVSKSRGDNRFSPYERSEDGGSSNFKASHKSRGGQDQGQRTKQADRSNNYYKDTKNNSNTNNKNGTSSQNKNRNSNSNNNNSNTKKHQKEGRRR